MTESSDGDIENAVSKSQAGGMAYVDISKTMEILSIPQFINYFKVSDEDEIFFEEVVSQMASLGTSDEFMQNGIPFFEIMNWLVETGFLLHC